MDIIQFVLKDNYRGWDNGVPSKIWEENKQTFDGYGSHTFD